MSEDFKRVKDSLDLLRVIEDATGFRMKKSHLEECPFCGGHGCFSLFPKDAPKDYKCHQCDAAGDVFVFLEKYHNVDKGESLRKAAELAGIKLESRSTARAVEMTVKERIFKAAAKYYNGNALEGAGREYFVDRRGHDERLLEEMKLGYADGGLKDHLLGQNYSIEDLVSSGLVQKMDKGNGKGPKVACRDYFPKDVAMFPHFDAKGRVIHFTQKDADPVRSKDPDKAVKWQLKKDYTDKSWRFYNQKALSGESVILVEGENDLLAVMSAGYRNVMAIIGQISEVQLKALQDSLKHKEIYIWLDDDGVFEKGGKGGKGGKGFTEKVCKALRGSAYGVRIIEHGGDAKDPDEHLKAISGDPRKEVQRLLEQAITYVGWQLKRVGELSDGHAILEALKERKMFATLAAMPKIDRFPYIETLKGMGITEEQITDAMEVNRELRDALQVIGNAAGGLGKADPLKVTRIIYEHFEANGKFFWDRDHKVYLLYQNYIYTINDNRPFNALMDRSGGLLKNKTPGPQVWEAMANQGFNQGTRIDVASWLATEKRRGAIYINFNSADNTILRISADGIKEVPNGLNEDDVLLMASKKIEPMEFNAGVHVKEGLETLKRLVLDNMTCDLEQRYFVICWLITAFLLDFMPYQCLLKFSGRTSSGKTTAAELVSMVIYGKEELGIVSSAAAFSMASQNPLVILDNLEEQNRGKAIKDFLLLAATRGSKEKRAGGTDSDTIQEKPKSLVLITAIEPLVEPELINRTVDIEFSQKHASKEFIKSAVLMDIAQERENMLSAILKLIQAEILPGMAEGIRMKLAILKDEYRGHSKDRVDEYMALLMLILEKILPHMPLMGHDDHTNNPAEIWREWFRYQDRMAREDETQGNAILQMLDGLASAYVEKMRGCQYEQEPLGPQLGVKVYRCRHDKYLLEMEKTKSIRQVTDENGKECEPYDLAYLQFTARSGEIVNAVNAWCRETGARNPYDNASRFTKRLMNDLPTLKRAGWTIIINPALEHRGPYSKMIRGLGFITLRKELTR